MSSVLGFQVPALSFRVFLMEVVVALLWAPHVTLDRVVPLLRERPGLAVQGRKIARHSFVPRQPARKRRLNVELGWNLSLVEMSASCPPASTVGFNRIQNVPKSGMKSASSASTNVPVNAPVVGKDRATGPVAQAKLRQRRLFHPPALHPKRQPLVHPLQTGHSSTLRFIFTLEKRRITAAGRKSINHSA